MNIPERTKEVIESIVGKTQCDNPKMEDLGLDSMDVTELIMQLEEEFETEGLLIADGDMKSWEYFDDVVIYIQEKLDNV